jgi:hypothetical protein
MVKTADCQPILLAHSSGKYIMAIHSGWKGNRQAYPQKAIHEFCEYYSLEPEDLWVVRGPSLGPVASEFIHFDREWGNEFLPWYDTERHTMDLWMLLRDQIIRSGVQESHVLGIDLCTYANAEYFFSYRHFRRCGGCDGRQGSFIWIRDTN